MSAFIVDREVIVYIVQAAASKAINPHGGYFSWFWHQHRELRCGDYDTMAAIGQMLWDENVRNIESLYPDTVEDRDIMPTEADDSLEVRQSDFSPFYPEPDAVQLLKSIQFLDYQSSDQKGWKSSNAFAFLAALKERAIMALPEWEDAVWGAPARSAAVR